MLQALAFFHSLLEAAPGIVEPSLCFASAPEPPHAPAVVIGATAFCGEEDQSGVRHALDLVRGEGGVRGGEVRSHVEAMLKSTRRAGSACRMIWCASVLCCVAPRSILTHSPPPRHPPTPQLHAFMQGPPPLPPAPCSNLANSNNIPCLTGPQLRDFIPAEGRLSFIDAELPYLVRG